MASDLEVRTLIPAVSHLAANGPSVRLRPWPDEAKETTSSVKRLPAENMNTSLTQVIRGLDGSLYNPSTPYPCSALLKAPLRTLCKPSSSPQITCRPHGQTPTIPWVTLQEYRDGMLFQNQVGIHITPPGSEVQQSVRALFPVPWHKLSQGGLAV